MDLAKSTPVEKKVKTQKLSLEQKVEIQREKLRKLEKQHSEKKRAENVKNQNLIFEIIKANGMDKISSEIWSLRIEDVKKALG